MPTISPGGILFGDSPARFSTRLSPEESVRRLSSAMASPPFVGLQAFEGRHVFGVVSSKRVKLMWQMPFARSIFWPRFIGRFESTADGAVLAGRFEYLPIVKLVACFVAAMGFLAAFSTTSFSQSLPAVGIALAGFVSLHLIKWLVGGIQRNLAGFIAGNLASEGD